MKQRGFTLLETLVALVILTGAGAGLWWGLRQVFVQDARLYLRQLASEALLSEAERLQGLRQGPIHDSEFILEIHPTVKLRLQRTVLDSSRRENLMDPFLTDPATKQAWRFRPLEVKLEVWPDSVSSQNKPLSKLFVVLPDYQWY